MRRILIIGICGSGKSTLAVRLGRLLNLPVIHLDKQFWKPGWKMTPRDEWRKRVSELAAGDDWIMDGTFDSSLDLRLPRADTVVFMDYPTVLCLTRILKRVITSYGRVRSDLAPGCPERWDWEFMKWVWSFRRDIRPAVLESLDKYKGSVQLFVLLTDRHTREFVKWVRQNRSANESGSGS